MLGRLAADDRQVELFVLVTASRANGRCPAAIEFSPIVPIVCMIGYHRL